ncbi:hypothetical protein CALVIDRAFT_27703 [Calocera viscosa TUFC12733]|uniref:Uncharacterized protein n=1 Tax=Calocera viscosa (strain TUFC12733) TaxID=1330018 RepID=A0A167P9N3_CALVF|nr:hypothetical protein CALVIDRAFT_27703 [Calocera viscosa TUFC12733]
MTTIVSSFPLNQTGLVSIWTEGVVYGIFLPIFFTALYVLLGKHQDAEKINKPMLFTTLLMFCLATAHVSIDAWRMMAGYVYLDASSNEPTAFFRNMDQPTFSAKYAIYVSQNLVGDAFNIYRSWLVWQRTYWILPGPIVLWAASAATGYYCSGYLFSIASNTDSIFNPPYKSWITAFYVLVLAQNFISTTLIVVKLCERERRIRNQSKGPGTMSLHPVVVIVVESALLFLCAQLVLLILFATNSNAQFIVLESLSSLAGITFCLVIIRIAMHSQQFLAISPPNSGVGTP